jgi:hypothetical protein
LKQIYGKRNAAAHPPMEGTKVRIMEKHFTESETQLLESVCACALLKFEVI